MNKKCQLLLVLICLIIVTPFNVFSTDYSYNQTLLTINNASGCTTAIYTFSQKTFNNINAAHNTGNVCTITFPAGTDATTCSGGTFDGIAIGSMTKTVSQISFGIPVGILKNTTFTIVLNDITNANNNSLSCTISTENASGGVNTGTYSFSTTAGPSTQATGFSATSLTSSSMSINWVRGNGNNVIVIAKAGSAVDTDPVSGNTYIASAAFGSGNQIGTNNYVIYAGTGTNVNVTGLSASTTYYFAIYEFNGGGCYNINALTGNGVTTAQTFPGVSLNKPVSISGHLTLTDGSLVTSSTNILTINDGATSDNGSANSFVNGPMKKVGSSDFIFPIGKGTKLGKIEISSLGASSTFIAEYYDDNNGTNTTDFVSPLTSVSTTEYWTLDKISGNDCKITLFWENAQEGSITDCAYLTVAHWNSGISQWEEYEATATGDCSGTGPGSVTTNSTWSSFSPFKFGFKTPPPLGIKLSKINATCKGNYNEVKWATLSETDNEYFYVERSSNGIDFNAIEVINGAGNSETELNYTYNDLNPQSDNYYRLKQVDFDGKFSYSNVVSANCSEKSMLNNELTITGIDNNLGVQITSVRDQDFELKLFDQTGRLILYKKIYCVKGINTFNYNISYLSSALYMLIVQYNDDIMTKKIFL